jgi:TetR/AcrR family transcriptional regulator
MAVKTSKSNHQDRADRARKNILRAAIREFSANGLAGARTDAIAEAAKVNKALLYYYFKSKTGLYEAALDEAAGMVAESALAALDPKHSAGERVLRSALSHFDRVLSQQEFQSLMQQELVRFRQGESEAIRGVVEKLFRPMIARLEATIRKGMHSGELCEGDWMQVVYSMLGANVFYFLSAPMVRLAMPDQTYDRSSIACRRVAAMQFLGNALFVDRAHGAKLAKRVLADIPMPKIRNVQVWRKFS